MVYTFLFFSFILCTKWSDIYVPMLIHFSKILLTVSNNCCWFSRIDWYTPVPLTSIPCSFFTIKATSNWLSTNLGVGAMIITIIPPLVTCLRNLSLLTIFVIKVINTEILKSATYTNINQPVSKISVTIILQWSNFSTLSSNENYHSKSIKQYADRILYFFHGKIFNFDWCYWLE